MANWNNLPRRGTEGGKPGPKVNPPTKEPVGKGNPASLCALDMQRDGASGYSQSEASYGG